MGKINFDTFIKGENIDLICLNEDVINNSNWYNWFNDERTTDSMQQHYFSNTKEKQLNFFKSQVENNPSKIQLGILNLKDSILIGVISLSNINYINRTAEFAVIIGEKKYKNFNYFIEAARLIINHGFETLNLNRISSATIVKEIDTMFCKVLGFTHEGIFKEAVFKNGKYVDVYSHALLKKNYKKKIKK